MIDVLILCEFPTLNGGEHSMLSTLPILRASGVKIRVACPPSGPLPDALDAAGVERVGWSLWDSEGTRLSQADARELLANILQETRPDLLHCNSLSMGRLAGPVAAELGLPSLAHLRDVVKLSRQVITDLNRNTRLIAVSEATRNHHLAQGLAAERTSVLYNGVDLERFSPRDVTGELHRELGFPESAKILGVIGQICLRKGQDVFLEAFGRAAEASPELRAVIIGERYSAKEESRRFEQGLRDAADLLDGRVVFLGFRDDVAALLPELSLLVHPARQEPLGRVLLEAAAVGLPIAATDVGGTREILGSDYNDQASGDRALLVPANDPDALRAAILR
ncbi:MAG: glycosyltransferase family 4 protein, partial [Planctomycetales bacterium]